LIQSNVGSIIHPSGESLMRKRQMTRRSCAIAITLFTSIALAQNKPAASPFDADDPEIAMIKKLDWKSADFDALTPRQQCAALMAVNKGLSVIGAKADARLDLLTSYVDQNNLGPDFESARTDIASPPQVSFADMEKLGAAYLLSPAGQAKLGTEFANTSDSTLSAYRNMYEKSAQREFAETVDSRLQVRDLALFLQSQGKLDEFRDWAIVERARRQAEFEQQQADAKAKAAADKTARQQEAAERQRQEQIAQQQMAAALAQQQQQQAQSQPQPDNSSANYESDGWWQEPAYGWSGAYYYSNAYRGQVRDRAQNAYQRWQQSPRPTPLPAGRGGGARIRR